VRVFITGAGGQVGHELVTALARHDVTAVDHAALDVCDREAVRAAIAASGPDVVVHTAAWTAVDACEGDPERAQRVNAGGTANVTAAARSVNARVVYFSTDYVFDGTKRDPYVESDPPNPQSEYGKSKLGGERALGPDDTIVRISWVCGRHGTNMVKTILRLATEHDTLQFVDDQRGNPTFADDAAGMVARLVDDERAGLFHVTNQGAVSWFEFAQSVLSAAGLDPARVSPIATADLVPARPAPRPANSVLANDALRAAGIPLLPDFHEPLQRLVRELTAS
jgi:dTDP-4-dehydrorhamnose reductase